MAITAGAGTVQRATFALLGVACVALGIIGLFVPGLPTTEFVLAASYLFARSSPRLEAWLEANRWLGPPLRRFRENRGMPRKAKALSLLSMWAGIAISVYGLAAVGAAAQLAVISFGLIGTATIVFVVRTDAPRQPLILS
jgi:uncharacterized membrane protein YbaN (DUF454 family)